MDGSTHPPPKKNKTNKASEDPWPPKSTTAPRTEPKNKQHQPNNYPPRSSRQWRNLFRGGDPLRNSVYRGSGKSDNIHLHPGGFPRRGAHNPAPFRNVPRAVTQQDEPPRKITYEPRRVALRKPYFTARLRARNVARATAAELPPKRRPRYCLLPLSSFSGRDAGRGAVRSTVHLPARTDPNLLA